jgi:hypothetical protein
VIRCVRPRRVRLRTPLTVERPLVGRDRRRSRHRISCRRDSRHRTSRSGCRAATRSHRRTVCCLDSLSRSLRSASIQLDIWSSSLLVSSKLGEGTSRGVAGGSLCPAAILRATKLTAVSCLPGREGRGSYGSVTRRPTAAPGGERLSAEALYPPAVGTEHLQTAERAFWLSWRRIACSSRSTEIDSLDRRLN